MARGQTGDPRGFQKVGAKSENVKEGVEMAKRYCKGMTRKLSTREASWCRITICERLRWDRGDNDRICFEPAGRGKPDYNGGTGARAKTQPPGVHVTHPLSESQWNRGHFSMKKWESEKHKNWSNASRRFQGPSCH